ncbi:UNVERIFIED_CONTAM: hypothetical protein Slati_1246400 [Sesamum latifolium]|uniref:Neuronal PAS domain protein n=1 Tax=Sesamum latifolium TaxID=2727402 RepID=A0AAW2XFF6_9LAMI
MAFCSFLDLFSWIEELPPIPQWKTSSTSLSLCPSYFSNPSLKLSIKNFKNSYFSISIFADYNLPIVLWTSKSVVLKPTSNKLLQDNDIVSSLISNFIEDVLNYSPNRCPNPRKLPRLSLEPHNLKDVFNFSFLSLTFLICIYEAPRDVRSSCLNTLKDQFSCPKSRQVSKLLMRLLGSNIEELWMRSINLAITNWISELQAANSAIKTPSSLFSYSFSTLGLWKVQLYCPVIAMNVEKSSGPLSDDRLLFSLNYHQLEGVIQLNHKVVIREKWIEVMVNIDNIREISVEKVIEASFEPPNAVGLNFSAGETSTISLRPWKFEQSVYGNSAILNWFLHDSVDGREVFSSRPSKFALIHNKAWFKNRYTNADRAFTREGGVIFAGDEYGESVCWRVDRGCMGRSMEWEMKGWIWLTYWPNKHRSFYSETKRLEFREVVCLSLI